MKTIFAILIFAVAAQWLEPINITESGGSICSQATYIDKSTKISHFIYGDYIGNSCYYYYVKMDANEKISNPIKLSNLHKQFYNVFITGADNGKNIFVSFAVYRDDYADNLFAESEDNGETWYAAIQPRASNFHDEKNRQAVNILRVNNERLFAFYKMKDDIIFTTRAPGNKLWSAEQKIISSEKIVTADFLQLSSEVIYTKNNNYEIYVAFNNLIDEKSVPCLLISKNSGITWDLIKGPIGGQINVPTVIVKSDDNKIYLSAVLENQNENKQKAYVFSYESQNNFTEFFTLSLEEYISYQTIRYCETPNEKNKFSILNSFSKLAKSSTEDRIIILTPTIDPGIQIFLLGSFVHFKEGIWYIDTNCYENIVFVSGTFEDKLYAQKH